MHNIINNIMESKEDKTEACVRCRIVLPWYSLKYDDNYVQELVCRDCNGYRKCEFCDVKCEVNELILDKDNNLVCKFCDEHERMQCFRCKSSYYTFDLNYVCNGNYACEDCEYTIHKLDEREECYSD